MNGGGPRFRCANQPGFRSRRRPAAVAVAVFIHEFEFVLQKTEVSRYASAAATSFERGTGRIGCHPIARGGWARQQGL